MYQVQDSPTDGQLTYALQVIIHDDLPTDVQRRQTVGLRRQEIGIRIGPKYNAMDVRFVFSSCTQRHLHKFVCKSWAVPSLFVFLGKKNLNSVTKVAENFALTLHLLTIAHNFLKMGNPRPLFRLFLDFSNKQYKFYNKSM